MPSNGFEMLTKCHQTASKRLRNGYKRHRKKSFAIKKRSFLNTDERLPIPAKKTYHYLWKAAFTRILLLKP